MKNIKFIVALALTVLMVASPAMAVTVTLQSSYKTDRESVRNGTIAFDSDYATDGESLTAATLNLGTIRFIEFQPTSGYLFEYDYTANKVKVYKPVGAGTTAAGSSHNHSGAVGGTTAAGSSHTHSTTTKSLFLSHGGSDFKGSANTDSENTDQAAVPTNGTAVAANAAVGGGAWAHGALTSPDMGRNVCITITNDTGGGLNLYEGVMTFTITGTYNGAAQTSTITFTSTAGNKAVGNAPNYRYKYGTKPFDTVTNITLDNVPDNGLKIAAGLGSKIGLPTTLATPAEGDVVKITKNAANLSPSGIVDTTNNTVNLGALSDNDDFTIIYKATSYVSAIAAEAAHTHGATGLTSTNTAEATHTHTFTADVGDEVADHANLSALTAVKFRAVGY